MTAALAFEVADAPVDARLAVRSPAHARRTRPASRPASRGTAHADDHAGRFDPSALDQYLRDIAAYPLLSRADEARLAAGIAAGDRDALETLIRSNLRFVVSVAKRYQRCGVPLLDLIAEGNLGLIRAAHRFDPEQGVKFISYAVWWIRQAMLQLLAEQGRIIRVPLNRAGTIYRLGRRAAALEQELGREATSTELAEGMDLTADEVDDVLAIARPHLSLDAPTMAGADGAFGEHLADTAAAAPDAPLMESGRSAVIAESLAALNAREAKILRLYFGLEGEEPHTLEEIAAGFRLTRERVRQLKEKALGRLRKGATADALAQVR